VRRLHRAHKWPPCKFLPDVCHHASGDKITTIEGLTQKGDLHPVQAAFLEHDGFQCGYCTSGQIVSAAALLKEPCGYDTRNGHPINNNFADYMVPVNADIPETDCVFLDYPDTLSNEYGARGVGEIGLTEVASALTSATYHATGVRDLPIHIEHLLV
jgi:hypothetical protein